MGLIILALEPWARGSGVGLGPLTPEISLLNFYPPHVGVRLAHSISPYLHICTSLTSLDECTF